LCSKVLSLTLLSPYSRWRCSDVDVDVVCCSSGSLEPYKGVIVGLIDIETISHGEHSVLYLKVLTLCSNAIVSLSIFVRADVLT
jgi:hypothetical protein